MRIRVHIRERGKSYAKIRKSLSEHLIFLEEAFQAKHQNIISSSKWLKAEMRLCSMHRMVWHEFACFNWHIYKKDSTERQHWQNCQAF